MNTGFADERLLLIDNSPAFVFQHLKDWTQNYNISIYVAKSGFEGLEMYKEYEPQLVIISCDLHDINGMSLSTIIKDGEIGHNVSVYLFNIQGNILGNTKADFICTIKDKATLVSTLGEQVISFYELRRLNNNNSMEILRAKNDQYSRIPTVIDNQFYKTTNIFSAFSILSGDSFDYWTDDKNNLYGILIDCPGHDVYSYSLVKSYMGFIKKDLRMLELGAYEKIDEVFQSVNEDLYSIETSPDPVAGIIFKIDVEKGVFIFTTAGIPGIYIRRTGKSDVDVYECSNFLLGFDKDNNNFDTFSIPLFDVEEIIVCSDGLWEVTFSEDEISDRGKAKHDDVSGIIIKFKDAIHKPFSDIPKMSLPLVESPTDDKE